MKYQKHKFMPLSMMIGILALATPAFSNNDCVEHQWRVNGNHHLFLNKCGFTILLRAKYNNGYIGLWGPLKHGETGFEARSNPGSDANFVEYSYCNFSQNPACSPDRFD